MWNVLCDFLYTAELIPANPMSFVGRPKAAKPPGSPPQRAVAALLEAVDRDREPQRRSDWRERDLSLILTGLLAGCAPMSCAGPMSVIFAPGPGGGRFFQARKRNKDPPGTGPLRGLVPPPLRALSAPHPVDLLLIPP